MIKPAALKQWILLLITSLTLCACVDEKDTELTLPPINPNLSTESPEGIWLFHTKLNLSENSYKKDTHRELNNQYFLRQLVKIQKTEIENEYAITGGCKNYSEQNNWSSIMNLDETQLPIFWSLQDNKMSSNDRGQDGIQWRNIQYLDSNNPEFSWNYQETGELRFNNNLRLKGQLVTTVTAIHDYDTLDNQNIFDIFLFFLLTGYEQVQQNKRAEIEAVKLSDTTNFPSENELNYYLNIQSDKLDISHDSHKLSCLDTKKVELHSTKFEDGDIRSESDSYESLTLIFDTVPEETSPEESAPYEDNSIIISSRQSPQTGLSLHLMNSGYGIYHRTQACYNGSEDDCLENISFDIQQSIHQADQISVKGEIIEHDGSQVDIQAEVKFSP